MSKRVLALSFMFCFAGFALLAQAQEMASATKSEVPELTAFHEVIYEIWHTAYPAKDVKALRGLVPRINELAAKVFTAKLPGILREKDAKWQAGVAQFKAATEAYIAAAAGKDDQALLSAAEGLHTKYEALVRTLNPILKEMDLFHQGLYLMVHQYLPEKAYDKIRGASADLVSKAEAVAKAALPKSQETRMEAFKKAAAELLEAAKALDAAGKAHDHAGMESGVDKVHAKYQALEAIFG